MLENVSICEGKLQDCGTLGFTVLKHIIIVEIKMITFRIYDYYRLFQERNLRDKRGATVVLNLEL